MGSRKFTFGKVERLNSKIQIGELFTKGDSFFKYPFKVIVHRSIETEIPLVSILITVPKRNFKKAVDRNRIKRLIREAYRLNKHIIYEHLGQNNIRLNLAFIYTAKSILSYQEIERKIILILQTIKKHDAVSVD